MPVLVPIRSVTGATDETPFKLNVEKAKELLEKDADKRSEQYLELQKEFRDTSPFTMIYQLNEVAVVSNKVKDFIISPDTNYVLKASKE